MLLYLFITVSNLIVAGALTPGDFQVLISLYLTVAVAAGTLGQVWINLQNNAAGARRVFVFFDLPTEAIGDAQPMASPAVGRIELEQVSFAYPGGIPVLREIDLVASPGELIVIAGSTGSGKSTLAHLLSGYYPPSTGRVTLDGHDLRQLCPDAVRREVTYVFQEHQLFSDTVYRNIAFGNPSATAADVERAARRACADEFIPALPKGYDTPLGRGGARLSTGEKQRISIARGLLRDTPVIILDEPTASLDMDTEARFVEGLMELRQDHLVIVITHRPAVARAADRILLLDSGCLRATGRPDDSQFTAMFTRDRLTGW
jgi:ATP-binding cassette subfamily B protein